MPAGQDVPDDYFFLNGRLNSLFHSIDQHTSDDLEFNSLGLVRASSTEDPQEM